MLPETQADTFASFSDSVRQNTILDEKTTRLIYLASAMAMGCYP